jgi:hypothetical protein
MNKPELSIVMPGIRPHNWVRGLQSIFTATTKTFELIIVSPFPLPKEMENMANVKYIKDYGSPTRASQIGNTMAEGKFIFPNFCDDAIFIKGSIDANLELLAKLGDSVKNVITCKYSESKDFEFPERYQNDDYYRLVNAYPVNKETTPNTWWILNNPFWYRSYFEYLGGYDYRFGVCPLAHADLAMRAYRDGANIHLSQVPIMQVEHGQNDHQPIEQSQLGFDTPFFAQKYHESLSKYPIQIPMDNWKQAPHVWKFRFTT